MHDHIAYFSSNAPFVVIVYGIIIGVFVMCFYKQLLFSFRDSALLGAVLGLALFFLWFLADHLTALLGVLIGLSALLLMWALRN